MIEIQHFREAEASLLSLLGDVDDDSLLAARIHRTLLGLYERTGRSNRACAAAKAEFDILQRHNPAEDNNLANAYSNVGYAMLSAYKAAEGIKYLDKAIAIAKAVPEPARYQEYNIDRFLRNKGRCMFHDALLDFDEVEYFKAKVHGRNSHYDGEYVT